MKKPPSLLVKRVSAVALFSLVIFLVWDEVAQRAFSAAPTIKISGFSPQHAAEQASLEDQLKKSISTAEIRKQHRYFTSIPHPAGSIHDREVAEYIAAQWRKQGLEDVIIRQYDVLGTRPVSTSLEMVAPTTYQALLREAPYNVDPDTKIPKSPAPGWVIPPVEKSPLPSFTPTAGILKTMTYYARMAST